MSGSRRQTASLADIAVPRRASKAAAIDTHDTPVRDMPLRDTPTYDARDMREPLEGPETRAAPVARDARDEPDADDAWDKGGDITDHLAAAVPPANVPEPPPPASRPLEVPARAEEIVVYWERLRRGRPFPPLSDVDRLMVGASWPDSLIVAFEGGDTGMPRISRLGATDGAIEYTPMVTDWILTRARHAARRSTKLDEVQTFPIEGDTPRYRLLLMPLGASNGASDCVLCHLCRAA
jgi:hypothetical protein